MHASPSPPLTNAQLAARLRRIARHRAAQDHGYYRVRAFYQAAHVVARLPGSLAAEVRANLDLTRHPCIGGGKIARVLRLMVKRDPETSSRFLHFGKMRSGRTAFLHRENSDPAQDFCYLGLPY